MKTQAYSLLVAVFAALALSASGARAGQIDLLLELDYATASLTSGGAWSLFARTDEQGLFSISVPLAGINAGVTNELPFGRVNGSATNNAGFATFTSVGAGGVRQVIAGQVVAQQGGGAQQGVFYGVGTLANGSPAYAGRPSGATSIGPFISTLAGVQNNPWGGDTSLFPTAVTVASGTFAPGMTPDFGANSGLFDGRLFTSVGTISEPGVWTSDIEFTTRVIDDISFGVATGDYNADGRVDALDYSAWRDTLEDIVTPLTGADGDGDGEISQGDRAVWAFNYGRTAAAAASAIPEPASAGLGLLGALALARRVRLAGAA